MAGVVNGYLSVEDLRERLGDSAGRLNTNLLARAINGTSRAIERYTGRRFWQDATVVTRYYTPDDTQLVWVDDISTKTGLVVKSDTGLDGTYATTWSSADYQLEPLNADAYATGDSAGAYCWNRLRATGVSGFTLWYAKPTLSVTAKFGWSAIPDDVVEAAAIKAASLFRRKDAAFGLTGNAEIGLVRIGRADPDVVALLGPYCRPI